MLVCTNVIAEETQRTINVGSTFLHGSIEGYVQTPAGGHPGSTSSKRPTFNELGFNTISIYDGYVGTISARHELLFGAQLVRLSGKSTLSKDLTSQNKNFNSGEIVDADITLDWYRVNYLYHYKTLDVLGKKMIISPGAGLVLFDFHYKLTGAEDTVDRAYLKIGGRLGGEINWILTDDLNLKAQAFGSIPIPNTPSILSLELQCQYKLWKGRNFNSKLVAGIAYNRIDYEDKQTVPNHIRVGMGPLVQVGLNIEF